MGFPDCCEKNYISYYLSLRYKLAIPLMLWGIFLKIIGTYSYYSYPVELYTSGYLIFNFIISGLLFLLTIFPMEIHEASYEIILIKKRWFLVSKFHGFYTSWAITLFLISHKIQLFFFIKALINFGEFFSLPFIISSIFSCFFFFILSIVNTKHFLQDNIYTKIGEWKGAAGLLMYILCS